MANAITAAANTKHPILVTRTCAQPICHSGIGSPSGITSRSSLNICGIAAGDESVLKK
jgi:hypothetical protein